ncbi:leucine-rich repeat-containing protein 45 [Limanda limanda]|uniref:leucine-rich repeat-containing protein 45 n=1 Tax=Limanda limanda TaxID=27771 RepID=UPI0029C7FC4C|nr:leucine-rich repeat-containing protein 45 [Limanda limanda]XP_060950374.1 leucine-rich repeat-containing protein 45 [Limanda limanda]
MQDFRQTYLSLCKEGGVKPQESVVAQIQGSRAAHSPRLDLSGQSLSLDTCSVLARAFQKDITLTDVSLSDCMLSEEGAKVLLTGLCGNTTVKILDLKGNNLKSAGVEVLGTLLTCNKTLRRLVLEWNALGVWDEAFLAFCQGLASNSMLTQLDLRNNQINHHGATELALALKHNTTLEVLDLRWNNIGLLGGRILLEALQKNKRIVQLEMAGNNIPSDTLKALERTTGHNSDRQSTLGENHRKTQVLSKEIQTLKDKKSHQVLSLMETIDSQREEIRCSKRSTSIQIGQLQEALNERKSAVNSLNAKLQMTEEALALSGQKNLNMVELLTQVKVEKEEQMERQSRERKKEQEDCVLREGKLFREMQNLSETNSQLRNKVWEMERWCKSQQQQIFELKQELTNSTAELNLRLAQAEDRLETEKRRSKQALRDMDSLRQKEVEHVNCNLEESERALQEHIFKLEGQRIQLKEQEHVSSLEEKLRSVHSSLLEVQLHCSQQKQTISEIKAKTNHQSIEVNGLQRRIGELQQELLGKDQEKVAEVSQVRLELQEQIGHLQAERTLQRGLKEKICALERENKVLSSNHREVLLDKESEMSSMLEKLRLKEADILRMREDETNRASYLQSAFLTYVQGSPLGHCSSPKK